MDNYTFKGMKVVFLENEKLRIGILIDKGTDIFEFLYKPKDLDITWLSSNGVQNPNRYLSSSPDPLSTFSDYYPGGWQEIFPNGGPPSSSLGAQFGQHGEITNMPWDYTIVNDDVNEISVEFSVKTKKTPFFVTKRMSLRSNDSTVYVEEKIVNQSEVEIPIMWGQHFVFGHPFIDGDCFITMEAGSKVIPHPVPINAHGRRVNGKQVYQWPEAKDENGNKVDLRTFPKKGSPSEMLYLTDYNDAKYAITNPNKKVKLVVAWDKAIYPYLWVWQEFGATDAYPWYGRHYNIGLEPFSSMPTDGLEEAVKNKTALYFSPLETKGTKYSIQVNSYKE
ncbi:DUF4432 family protein [Terrihalobacillus insolitus]|uniref:DUF4432 family protein n=1 Tax=Terrihalobacillus insolitus TaxID=2950438 RepID=UPI00233FB213|nr:DUF4432 family protein [Terrihalobacillus insolitus]MDC3415152.1 aldose 1-epimerase family protein [Terrihalobacillus insolitus]